MFSGKKLEQFRLRASLSASELASRVGVTENEIVAWERGTGIPTQNQKLALAEALKIEAEELEEITGDLFCEDYLEEGEEEAEPIDLEEYKDKPFAKSEISWGKIGYRFYLQDNKFSIIYLLVWAVFLAFVTLVSVLDKDFEVIDVMLCAVAVFGVPLGVIYLFAYLKLRRARSLDRKVNYNFYKDYFEVDCSDNNLSYFQRVNYSEVVKYKFKGTYLIIYKKSERFLIDTKLFYGNVRRLISLLFNAKKGEFSLDLDSRPLNSSIQPIKGEAQPPQEATNKQKPTPQKVKALSSVCIGAALVSSGVAIVVMEILFHMSPFKGVMNVTAYSIGAIFYFFVLPLISLIIGVILLFKGHRGIVVAQVIISAFISVGILFFGGIYKGDVEVSCNCYKDVVQEMDIGSFKVEKTMHEPYWGEYALKVSSAEEFERNLATDGRWTTSFDDISANLYTAPSTITDFDYFTFYDKECNEYNGTDSMYQHSYHEYVFMAYDIEENILYIQA